jgi:hypothetical protein
VIDEVVKNYVSRQHSWMELECVCNDTTMNLI